MADRAAPDHPPRRGAARRGGPGGVRRALRRARRDADRPDVLRGARRAPSSSATSTAVRSPPAPGGGAPTWSSTGSSLTAEVKRMYVAPRARGRGLARADARPPRGHRPRGRCRGDGARDGMRQPEAIALYESSGYQPIPGFGFYKDAPLSRCFARSLRQPALRGRGPEGCGACQTSVCSWSLLSALDASCCGAAWRAGPRRRRPTHEGSPNGRSSFGIGLVVRLLERGAVVGLRPGRPVGVGGHGGAQVRDRRTPLLQQRGRRLWFEGCGTLKVGTSGLPSHRSSASWALPPKATIASSSGPVTRS